MFSFQRDCLVLFSVCLEDSYWPTVWQKPWLVLRGKDFYGLICLEDIPLCRGMKYNNKIYMYSVEHNNVFCPTSSKKFRSFRPSSSQRYLKFISSTCNQSFHILHSVGLMMVEVSKRSQDGTAVPSWLRLETVIIACMQFTNAEYTVGDSWWWAKKFPETCRVLWENKFG